MQRRWLQGSVLWPSGLTLLLAAIALASRSLFPIDETRYTAVAWEMWLRGDFLVPHLNGNTYSHKPPLLFWLINLGWGIFGVNEWWPRLVPVMFQIATFGLAAHVSHLLWPTHNTRYAPFILAGSLFWAGFTALIFFDFLVTFFALLGIYGIIVAMQRGGLRGWLVFGIAMGLGVLAKGPVILLHVLPAALLAPWWIGERRDWWRWYGGVFIGVVVGVAISLSWAIPAARAGGPDYAHMIFWGQSAERMVESFAHRHPFWWYLPLLPLMLFPWFVWPALWRKLAPLLRHPPDAGVRLCIAWIVPSFLIVSLISGKQAHYLLPLFPAFALLADRALSQYITVPVNITWPIVGVMLVGILLTALPFLQDMAPRADWLVKVSPLWGTFVVAIALYWLYQRQAKLSVSIISLSCAAVLIVGVINLGIITRVYTNYNLTGISQYLGTLQKRHIAVAHIGKYHGQFHMLGRLREPIHVIDEGQLPAWIEQNPEGRVVLYYTNPTYANEIHPEYVQRFRGGVYVVWHGTTLLVRPDLFQEW